MYRRTMSAYGIIILLACAGSCAKPPHASPAADEQAVRAAVADFQTALQNNDANGLWTLLHAKSRSEAGLAGLSGRRLLENKQFQRKYHELPGSTIDRVTVQGETATVYYTEPDGDKEKLPLVRQDGQWKLWLVIPKGNDP